MRREIEEVAPHERITAGQHEDWPSAKVSELIDQTAPLLCRELARIATRLGVGATM